MSDPIEIKKGVRQGCVLSPSLFNLYTEFIFRETEDLPGVKIGGINLNNIRYADDTVLLTENEQDLQNLVTSVEKESKKYGLKMNVKKTKTMIITKKQTIPKLGIKVDEKYVEQVESFIYLGQRITEDGRSESEVIRRIAKSKNAFASMHHLLTSRNIRVATRMRLVRCFIWSLFLYGCETWTLTTKVEKKIEAFEMWIYRRILKISWKEKKTNKYVLNEMNLEKTQLLNTIHKRKIAYYGHIRRHETLQKIILEGMMEGKRGRGRRRKSWTINLTEMTGRKMNQCCKIALDREEWRTMASNLYAETEHR